MKYIRTYEASTESKFKEGDWVVAENLSHWYEDIWPNLDKFLRNGVGRVVHSFDLGGWSYNVLYLSDNKDEEFTSAYYNNNSMAYVGIDRSLYKIYGLRETGLRLATDEEIRNEKESIDVVEGSQKYNL